MGVRHRGRRRHDPICKNELKVVEADRIQIRRLVSKSLRRRLAFTSPILSEHHTHEAARSGAMTAGDARKGRLVKAKLEEND
jgi:hypothetical protein